MRRSRTPERRTIAKRPGKNDVADWLREHGTQMIICPNQPGKLRIMPQVCAKRHAIANESRWMNTQAESFPVYVFKMNLIPCRRCLIGARCASQKSGQVA